MCQPVKQKLKKFKPDMSLKIKEEVTKQIKAKVLRVVEYPTWLANIMPVSKKDGKVRSTVIYEPIFMMLRKDAKTSWTEDCQKAFDKIKEYLSTPLVLVVKGQALADHLAENLVGGAYEPLKTYFPDEDVSFIGEDITEAYDDWRMFFDGAANFKGVGIGAVLVSEKGQHYPKSSKLIFPCTNNMAEYESCILGLNMAVDMNIQELLEIDGKPWFHDIKEYLSEGKYLEHPNNTQKCTLRRLSNHFFHSGGNLYRRTPDLGLLSCVDVKETSKYVRKCFQCQVHADMIKVPPNELNATSST
ncbi:uncharacterized protein [Nicotiana sylvestris]|uniref:uncharacterized protein n=1 Tax=Nicotiana sylvestris TaxID=4096 RepID=UPI00388C6ACE